MKALLFIALFAVSQLSQAATVEISYTPSTTRVDGTPCDGCTHRLAEGATVIADPVPTPYQFQAAPGDHTYSVVAVDPAGIYSVPTLATVTVPEPPVLTVLLPPADVALAIGAAGNTVTVSWGAVEGAVNYSVMLNGSIVGTVKGLSSMRTLAPGRCLTPYDKYTVLATDATKRKSIPSLPASLTRVLCVAPACVAI